MDKRDIIARIDAIEAELRGVEVRLARLRHELADEWRVDAEPPRTWELPIIRGDFDRAL